jgi:ABC-type glycerol-3-phosphate transport system permease component
MSPNRIGAAGAVATVLLLAAFTLPLDWMVVGSLTEEALLFTRPQLFPADPTTDHYFALFRTREFMTPIVNSLIVAGTTTVFCVSLGSLCAYAVARLRFPGKSLVLALVLAVSMFPQVAIVSPLYLVLRELGLIDTYAGLVLPYLTFAMPLTIWLLVGFFRQLPPDIEEAALVDGAGRFRVLVDVIAPLSLPGIATTAIHTFLYAWNEFLIALTFTGGPDHQTVPVAIALLRGRYQIPWGEIHAASVVASVPVALLVLFLQRRIVSGLTAGAVKG